MQKFAGLLAKEIVSARGGSAFGGNDQKLTISGAFVLALSGNLGAGKTTFTQGFLRALEVKGKITSPTFILMQRFVPGSKYQVSGVKQIYHIDCYRIDQPNEFEKLGVKKILRDPQNIVLIEWAERIKKILPRPLLWVEFEHGGNLTERFITLQFL